jgi:hypothetical protein
MKSIIRLVRKWQKNSQGTSLAELMTAMAVGGFIIASIFTIMAPLFHVSTSNSNYMAAFHQVQNSGDWISRDALMAQGVYGMASTELRLGIDDSQVTIPVNNTLSFPPSGVICIEDELIQYNSKTGNTLGDCTRGDNATEHDVDESVALFIALNWIDWYGNRHLVVYNLKETSHHLMRSYLTREVSETSYNLVSSTLIAEAINFDVTTSSWDYGEKELTVEIAATVGDYILLKTGIWESTAARTYKINPRPFF